MIIKLEDVDTFAKEVLNKVFYKENGAFVVFLQGDLGSGKTTTTKAVARCLGVSDEITSPTFVILKRYEILDQGFLDKGFKNLIHIDAYRLKNYDELRKIKFEEYAANASNLMLIEWPQMVEDMRLVADMTLGFEYGVEDGERVVVIL